MGLQSERGSERIANLQVSRIFRTVQGYCGESQRLIGAAKKCESGRLGKIRKTIPVEWRHLDSQAPEIRDTELNRRKCFFRFNINHQPSAIAICIQIVFDISPLRIC